MLQSINRPCKHDLYLLPYIKAVFSVRQCFQFSVVVCGAFPPLTSAFYLGDNNSVGNDTINFFVFFSRTCPICRHPLYSQSRE